MPTVMINGKKHTPSSGTLKKMKAKMAAEAAAKKPAAARSQAKPPVPATRSKPPMPMTMSDKTAASRRPVPGLKVPTGAQKGYSNSDRIRPPLPGAQGSPMTKKKLK